MNNSKGFKIKKTNKLIRNPIANILTKSKTLIVKENLPL